ncbi:hypothetical protein RJ639_007064 [Escallonia herrerae]|uniref:Retrotransposon gag domain-containing protein n=1 Tax=Escallonia herrerae TaxID=1293975 RepID=A0AA88VYF6_9ASTE|nr:hypothetical protein RJ639_007064 [Escallonia herrerae]
MPEPRSYDGTREARQVDNFLWCLEQYFEALDIDDKEEHVQWTVATKAKENARAEIIQWSERGEIGGELLLALEAKRRYTDGCNIKTWDKLKLELKRQFYPESIEDMAMINLRWLRQKGSIHEYVNEYSNLMLKIPEMSERQRLCFFIDGLHQLVATELRHEHAKDGGDSRSKSGLPNATDDKQSGDEGRRRRHKGEKKHEGSHKQGDSRDYKAHGGLREGCFYCADSHYRKDCQHKGKMIVFLKKHKGSNGGFF